MRNAAVGVAKPRMPVHAVDDQAANRLLEGHGEVFIALLRCRQLRFPGRERMGRRRHDRGAVLLGSVDHQPPCRLERLAQARDGITDDGIRLDLGAEKLLHDPMRAGACGAGFEDAGVGVVQQIAGVWVDEEELLLDAQGYRQVGVAIGFAHGSRIGRRQGRSG